MVWDKQEDSRLVALYRRFLEWDLIKRPWLTRAMEWVLDKLKDYKTNAEFFESMKRK